MRIGVVSDTHNNLKSVAKIVEIFNNSEVDRVIHTGDITQAKTINAFDSLKMPLYGVFGNNDLELDTLNKAITAQGFFFQEPPMRAVWESRKIIVVHDPLDFAENQINLYDLAIHGHTHRYRLEQDQETIIFNPGECAGQLQGHNAVGIVDLITLRIEIKKF